METKEYLICKNDSVNSIILQNNEYCLQSKGNHEFQRDIYQDLYDKDGNFIMNTKVKTERITKKDNTLIFNHNHCGVNYNLVQINFDFYLVPFEGYIKLDDFHKDIRLLNNSKNTFPNTKFNYTSKDRYTLIPNPKDMVDTYSIELGEHVTYELTTISSDSTVTITNVINPENVDAKQYRDNYKKALKKFPRYEYYIKELFKANCLYHKIPTYNLLKK